jgi:Fanconi anemia group M protein
MIPLHDIFSKSKDKEDKKKLFSVKIDYREKNSLVASELVKLGAEIEFKEMKVADYLVNNVAIERKTVSDFISSMISKRLMRQLEDLQQYPKRLLIIEGISEQELYQNDESEITGIHPNAIRGFLLSILLTYQVPIIFSKDYTDTASFISLIGKKKISEHGINPKKRSRDVKEQMQFIIEGFPRIGPKSSKKLLQEFKTIKEIINSSEEDLSRVLGNKKSKIIRELIEKEY